MQESEKKSVLAVQTLRNSIMGTTLMATTSILLCSALGALLSSTYSVKAPLQAMDSAAGDTSPLLLALKYVVLLLLFLFAFLCYSLSIRFINQVAFLINLVSLTQDDVDRLDDGGGLSPEYVADLLEKSFLLNIIGNRIFYSALPLLLWIVGPVLVFLCSAVMLPILYNLDVCGGRARRNGKNAGAVGAADTTDTSCTIVGL